MSEDDLSEDEEIPLPNGVGSIEELQVGDFVSLTTGDGREGHIRFIGETEFSPGLWFGIELSSGSGRNDGQVKGIRYFNCEEGMGLFIRGAKIDLASVIQAGENEKTGEDREDAKSVEDEDESEENSDDAVLSNGHKITLGVLKQSEETAIKTDDDGAMESEAYTPVEYSSLEKMRISTGGGGSSATGSSSSNVSNDGTDDDDGNDSPYLTPGGSRRRRISRKKSKKKLTRKSSARSMGKPANPTSNPDDLFAARSSSFRRHKPVEKRKRSRTPVGRAASGRPEDLFAERSSSFRRPSKKSPKKRQSFQSVSASATSNPNDIYSDRISRRGNRSPVKKRTSRGFSTPAANPSSRPDDIYADTRSSSRPGRREVKKHKRKISSKPAAVGSNPNDIFAERGRASSGRFGSPVGGDAEDRRRARKRREKQRSTQARPAAVGSNINDIYAERTSYQSRRSKTGFGSGVAKKAGPRETGRSNYKGTEYKDTSGGSFLDDRVSVDIRKKRAIGTGGTGGPNVYTGDDGLIEDEDGLSEDERSVPDDDSGDEDDAPPIIEFGEDYDSEDDGSD